MIETDICIIGAGPVGLFAVFEAGLLKMRCHLVDALPQVGGQLAEVYPQKPIYDIPGFPSINALELVNNLMEQIEPFKPGFTIGERVDAISKQSDSSFMIVTNEQTSISCKVVVIAGGLGCFEPRKPAIDNLQAFEGKGVAYMVKNPELLRGRRVVIAGGGDSALDWTLFLADVAERVVLVHRGDTFRGSPDSAKKVFDLAKAGKIDLLLNCNVTGVDGYGHLQQVNALMQDGQILNLKADYFIPLFGLTPKLGPIAEWGLQIDRSAIEVNTTDFGTNIPGIFAIGDINTYPGKLKLILCGFHEAALMAQAAFRFIHPGERLNFKYTTVYGVNSF